ncbi:MAG: hypothetical protein HFE42_01125 [Clostridia bacterium]|nr:hypothetical protein [Clostridia bacterium]
MKNPPCNNIIPHNHTRHCEERSDEAIQKNTAQSLPVIQPTVQRRYSPDERYFLVKNSRPRNSAGGNFHEI